MRELTYKPWYCPQCGEPFLETEVTQSINKFEFFCSCGHCTPGAIIITVILGKGATP